MTRVIIAGAGIGGLTAALACLQRGFDVVLLEASSELSEVGAGIQITPNAVKVLQALGVANDVTARAFRPEAIEARMGKTGRPIFNIPLEKSAQTRWGAPYLHIHRAHYVAALAKRLPENVLRLDTRLSHYDITPKGVRVTLADGSALQGDVLIGADGIRSVVRDAMLGPQSARFTGNVAWRAVVPISKLGPHIPRPTACAWFGCGRHAVTYRLGPDGELANFVGVVERDDWREESWSTIGDRADALADFANWHPVVKMLIEQAETLNRWALFDRDPLPRWTDGPVALLGDAAHPMLPFLAQGAAMAVEDAYVLALNLSQADPIVGLQNYADSRQARTAKVQAASRANMSTFHKRTLFSQVSTYGPMWLAGKFAPRFVHGRMDWIYGHDVTKL